MTEDILLPFDLPAVRRKKVTADFEGGSISSDGGLVLLRGAVSSRLSALLGPRDGVTLPTIRRRQAKSSHRCSRRGAFTRHR